MATTTKQKQGRAKKKQKKKKCLVKMKRSDQPVCIYTFCIDKIDVHSIIYRYEYGNPVPLSKSMMNNFHCQLINHMPHALPNEIGVANPLDSVATQASILLGTFRQIEAESRQLCVMLL